MNTQATTRKTNIKGIGVTNVPASADISSPSQPLVSVQDAQRATKSVIPSPSIDGRTLRTAVPSHPAQLIDENERCRDLSARDLHLRLETVDAANRTVEAIIATEAPTTVLDMRTFRVVDEVLLMSRFEPPRNNQVPLLESHYRCSTDFVHGSIRDIRVEGKQLVGRLHFAEDEESLKKWGKVRDRHVTDISSGNRQLESVEEIQPGQSRVIEGKTYEATDKPLQVPLRWTTREGSLVAIGADPNATTRHDVTPHAERGSIQQEPKNMNKKLREYLESLGLRTDATDEQAWAFLGQREGDEKTRAEEIRSGKSDTIRQEPPVTTPVAPAAVVTPPASEAIAPRTETELAAEDKIRTEERSRIDAIEGLRGPNTPDDVITRAIKGDSENGGKPMTVEQAKAAILDSERAAVPAPVNGSFNVQAHGNPGDEITRAVAGRIFPRQTLRSLDFNNRESTHTQMGIAARLMLDQGMESELLGDENTLDAVRAELERVAERSDKYRGMGLPHICREAVRLGGEEAPYDVDDCLAIMQRSAVSTSSLTNIFSAVVNKILLAGYQETTDTTLGWVRENDNANFKTNERHRMGKTAQPKKLARGGTAKDASYGDEKESYKISRYAQKFVIDEQDIIDDDMNALMQIPHDMGLAIASLRADLVYAILLANANLSDNLALFVAGHGNLTTPALARPALEAAVAAMGKQRISGRTLNIRPKYLIIPQDLEDVAVQLIRSREIREGGGGGSDEVLTYNTVLRLGLNIRVDDRLGVAGVTDPDSDTAYAGTATNWFLSSDGSNREIEVGYRRGTNRRPIMRSFVLDKGQFGIGWDIKHDIGAKALGFRGMHMSDGTT